MPWLSIDEPFARPPKLRRRSAAARPAESVEVIDAWLDVVGRSITNGRLDGSGAEVVELDDSILESVELVVDGGVPLRVRRCRLERVDLSGCRIESLIESELVDCKLAGTDLGDATIRDVEFERCLLRATECSAARFERVRFSDCQMEEVRFVGSSLVDTATAGSTLQQVDLDRASFERMDLRGAIELDFVHLPPMPGVLITESQALELALLSAHSLGFGIERIDF